MTTTEDSYGVNPISFLDKCHKDKDIILNQSNSIYSHLLDHISDDLLVLHFMNLDATNDIEFINFTNTVKFKEDEKNQVNRELFSITSFVEDTFHCNINQGNYQPKSLKSLFQSPLEQKWLDKIEFDVRRYTHHENQQNSKDSTILLENALHQLFFKDEKMLMLCKQYPTVRKCISRLYSELYPIGIPHSSYCHKNHLVTRHYFSTFLNEIFSIITKLYKQDPHPVEVDNINLTSTRGKSSWETLSDIFSKTYKSVLQHDNPNCYARNLYKRVVEFPYRLEVGDVRIDDEPRWIYKFKPDDNVIVTCHLSNELQFSIDSSELLQYEDVGYPIHFYILFIHQFIQGIKKVKDVEVQGLYYGLSRDLDSLLRYHYISSPPSNELPLPGEVIPISGDSFRAEKYITDIFTQSQNVKNSKKGYIHNMKRGLGVSGLVSLHKKKKGEDSIYWLDREKIIPVYGLVLYNDSDLRITNFYTHLNNDTLRGFNTFWSRWLRLFIVSNEILSNRSEIIIYRLIDTFKESLDSLVSNVRKSSIFGTTKTVDTLDKPLYNDHNTTSKQDYPKGKKRSLDVSEDDEMVVENAQKIQKRNVDVKDQPSPLNQQLALLYRIITKSLFFIKIQDMLNNDNDYIFNLFTESTIETIYFRVWIRSLYGKDTQLPQYSHIDVQVLQIIRFIQRLVRISHKVGLGRGENSKQEDSLLYHNATKSMISTNINDYSDLLYCILYDCFIQYDSVLPLHDDLDLRVYSGVLQSRRIDELLLSYRNNNYIQLTPPYKDLMIDYEYSLDVKPQMTEYSPLNAKWIESNHLPDINVQSMVNVIEECISLLYHVVNDENALTTRKRVICIDYTHNITLRGLSFERVIGKLYHPNRNILNELKKIRSIGGGSSSKISNIYRFTKLGEYSLLSYKPLDPIISYPLFNVKLPLPNHKTVHKTTLFGKPKVDFNNRLPSNAIVHQSDEFKSYIKDLHELEEYLQNQLINQSFYSILNLDDYELRVYVYKNGPLYRDEPLLYRLLLDRLKRTKISLSENSIDCIYAKKLIHTITSGYGVGIFLYLHQPSTNNIFTIGMILLNTTEFIQMKTSKTSNVIQPPDEYISVLNNLLSSINSQNDIIDLLHLENFFTVNQINILHTIQDQIEKLNISSERKLQVKATLNIPVKHNQGFNSLFLYPDATNDIIEFHTIHDDIFDVITKPNSTQKSPRFACLGLYEYSNDAKHYFIAGSRDYNTYDSPLNQLSKIRRKKLKNNDLEARKVEIYTHTYYFITKKGEPDNTSLYYGISSIGDFFPIDQTRGVTPISFNLSRIQSKSTVTKDPPPYEPVILDATLFLFKNDSTTASLYHIRLFDEDPVQFKLDTNLYERVKSKFENIQSKNGDDQDDMDSKSYRGYYIRSKRNSLYCTINSYGKLVVVDNDENQCISDKMIEVQSLMIESSRSSLEYTPLSMKVRVYGMSSSSVQGESSFMDFSIPWVMYGDQNYTERMEVKKKSIDPPLPLNRLSENRIPYIMLDQDALNLMVQHKFTMNDDNKEEDEEEAEEKDNQVDILYRMRNSLISMLKGQSISSKSLFPYMTNLVQETFMFIHNKRIKNQLPLGGEVNSNIEKRNVMIHVFPFPQSTLYEYYMNTFGFVYPGIHSNSIQGRDELKDVYKHTGEWNISLITTLDDLLFGINAKDRKTMDSVTNIGMLRNTNDDPFYIGSNHWLDLLKSEIHNLSSYNQSKRMKKKNKKSKKENEPNYYPSYSTSDLVGGEIDEISFVGKKELQSMMNFRKGMIMKMNKSAYTNVNHIFSSIYERNWLFSTLHCIEYENFDYTMMHSIIRRAIHVYCMIYHESDDNERIRLFNDMIHQLFRWINPQVKLIIYYVDGNDRSQFILGVKNDHGDDKSQDKSVKSTSLIFGKTGSSIENIIELSIIKNNMLYMTILYIHYMLTQFNNLSQLFDKQFNFTSTLISNSIKSFILSSDMKKGNIQSLFDIIYLTLKPYI